MPHPQLPLRNQRGAALVVGLILLLVLTLLAVSGMNMASAELTMAGSEQYRQNAARAAETGIEQAISVVHTVPQTGTAVTVSAQVPGSNSTADTYTTSTRYVGDSGSIPGFSSSKFTAMHYEIASTGRGPRNTSASQVQGVFVVQATSGETTLTPLNP